jgi:hypothetical protein
LRNNGRDRLSKAFDSAPRIKVNWNQDQNNILHEEDHEVLEKVNALMQKMETAYFM